MKIRRRRIIVKQDKGWSYSTTDINPPARKLQVFKAGQKIPAGAQYLTFAIKNNIPKFFFLVNENNSKSRHIGFQIEQYRGKNHCNS